jgi:MerR family transcriptional regulator, copper efflux regulator
MVGRFRLWNIGKGRIGWQERDRMRKEEQGQGAMNIGRAAESSGVSAKMIRHYEAVGLLKAAARTEGGYRIYSMADVHTLRFIKSARSLGFPILEIGKLLDLWRNRSRASSKVKALALAHVRELETKAAELQGMADTLKDLAHCCKGDHRPECPILEGLSVGKRSAAHH